MKGSDGQVAGGLLGLLLLASERVGRLPWLTGSTLGVSRSLGAGWLAAWLGPCAAAARPQPLHFVISQHLERRDGREGVHACT